MSTTIYQQPWLTSSNFSYPRPLQADTLTQQKPERTHMYANKVFVPRRQCSSWSAHERMREWKTMQMGGEKKINLLINTSWLKRVGRIMKGPEESSTSTRTPSESRKCCVRPIHSLLHPLNASITKRSRAARAVKGWDSWSDLYGLHLPQHMSAQISSTATPKSWPAERRH